jgi:phenylacetate-coenzyme A ligase PaaK-like adenylate-forming protein
MKVRVNTKARRYDNKEHGQRILFSDAPTNPRDTLGKNGVYFHSRFANLFRKTAAIDVTIIKKDGSEKTKTIYLDRKSLLNYLVAIPHLVETFIATSPTAKAIYDDQVTKDKSVTADACFREYVRNNPAALAEAIDVAVQTAKANAANGEFSQVYHAGQVGTEKMTWKTGLRDNVTGSFFSWLYQSTIGSLSKIKVRFAFVNTEQDYAYISESMARLRFKEARADVPAYSEFLAAHPPASGSIDRFSDIPFTSKKTYILPKQSVGEDCKTHRHGKYPVQFKQDTSTGTTGTPTHWLRSDREVKTVEKSFNVAREVEFGDRQLYSINAFALGPWATGMTVFSAMRKMGSVFATGPDIEKIITGLINEYSNEQTQIKDAIAKLIKRSKTKLDGKDADILTLVNAILDDLLDDKNTNISARFNALADDDLKPHKADIVKLIVKLNQKKKQYLLSGYPPFLKAVADEANARGLNFKKFHIRGVVGGQGMSDTFRDSLLKAGYVNVNSSYGASDLDINIGADTDYEIRLRKEIEKNPALARDLFGTGKGTPMVFHYDPLSYLIEADKQDKLYFTCLRIDRSSPRIRYDLDDTGRVYASSDIQAILLKHGITDLQPRINFRLLFIWGRDAAVSFNGSKVFFDDLEHAVTTIDKKGRFAKRAFYKYTEADGSEKFDILIELKKGEKMLSRDEAHDVLRDLIVKMALHNQDFLSHLGRGAPTPYMPRLRIFEHNKSPISGLEGAEGARKQVLVFDKNNMKKDYDIHQASKTTTFSIKKDETFSAKLEGGPSAAAKSTSVKKSKSTHAHKPKSPALFQAAPASSDAQPAAPVTKSPSKPKVKEVKENLLKKK